MNRKAGLQKKVSSIFDEIEAPSESVQSVLAGRADPGGGVDCDKSERIMSGGTLSGSTAAVVVEDDVAVSSPAVSESAKFFKSILPAKHQRNRKLFVLTAVIILFWTGVIVRSYFSGPAEKNNASKSTVSAKEISDADSKDTIVEWLVPEQVGDNIRDIAVSGGRVVSSASTGSYVVRGILLSEDNNSAIIGNHIVHTGEQIGGATVVGITKKTVEFEKDGKRWVQEIEK
ncbi:MAG: hypothetical protein FVQ79_06260 [Planctomycetes bacterium]|nr:hypothetical protein [Planctomycetota bacterium]